jgi:ATP-dependent DNA ligase
MQRDYEVALKAFDLLKMGEEDLTQRPYRVRRKRLLEALTDYVHPDAKIVSVLANDDNVSSAEFFKQARALGCEGIMLKNPIATYQPGRRSHDWLKVKPLMVFQAFVLKAIPGNGKFTGMMGALELGLNAGEGKVVYIGRCGTGQGWTNEARQQPWPRFTPVTVGCYELTEDRKLWHPRYLGPGTGPWQNATVAQLDNPKTRNPFEAL